MVAMVECFFRLTGGTKEWNWTRRKFGKEPWERAKRTRVCTKSWSSQGVEVGREEGLLQAGCFKTSSVLNKMFSSSLSPQGSGKKKDSMDMVYSRDKSMDAHMNLQSLW